MAKLLLVDDLDGNLRLLEALLLPEGHTVVSAGDGLEALSMVRRERPDLVLMDVRMPHMDGFEACRAIKADPATKLTPVILVSSLRDTDSRIRGIDAGADDFVSKPFDRHELIARVRSLVRLKRYTDDLDCAESVIVSLALTIEARDETTDGHCQRLAQYAAELGRVVGLEAAELKTLERGGILHDIGKIGIPDALLLKRGPLTAPEFAVMKTHTVIGDRLCGGLRALERVRPIVRHHHERLDGSGYPDGLRGDAVPLLAQITAICDVFDALTTDRPYRAALPFETAADELARDVSAGRLRGDLVDAFLSQVVGWQQRRDTGDGTDMRLQNANRLTRLSTARVSHDVRDGSAQWRSPTLGGLVLAAACTAI